MRICKPLQNIILLSTSLATAAAAQTEIESISLDSLINAPVDAASRYRQSARNAPASVTVVTAADFRRFGYENLSDVLAGVRGFYTGNDRNYSYTGVRGFSRPTDYDNRIAVLLNGQRINEDVYGSSPSGLDFGLSLEAVERVEIVRGPGASLYGSGAMIAVVNVVTRDGARIDGVLGHVQTGSHGLKTGTLTYGGRLAGGLDVMVTGRRLDSDGEDLYFAEFDDPETNNGLARGLDRHEATGVMALAKKGELRLQGWWMSSCKGVPTAAFGTAFGDNRLHTLDEYGGLEGLYRHVFDARRSMTIRAYLSSYNYEGDYPYTDEEYNTLFSDTSDGRTIGGELRFDWHPGASNRVVAGIVYLDSRRADYRAWDEEEALFSGDFPYRTTSIYVQEHFQATPDLALVVGARADHASQADAALSPRAAVIYHASGSGMAKLLYGQAYRAPNVYESFYESPNSNRSNPDLEAETVRMAEAIWEQRFGEQVFGILSAYRYTFDKLIDSVEDPEDGLVQFQNLGEAHGDGIEAEIRAQSMTRGVALSFAWQRARDAEDRRLSNSPARIARAQGFVPVWRSLRAAGSLRHESGRRTVYETSTDGFLLADAALHYDVTTLLRSSKSAASPALTISLKMRNLFDTDYANPGGFEHEQASLPQPGRALSLSLRARL